MAYTTINKSTANLDTNLYTANGSGKTISGMDFKPDFIWSKNRDNASYIHAVVDAVRGGTKKLFPNADTAETTDTNAVTSFTSDGYVFGSSGSFNYSTNNYVNWCWKGAGTSGSANTDGSINSTVSANQAAGFSIVKYTGTSSNASVGHGLNAKPTFIIAKRLTDAESWGTYHVSNGASKYIKLESNETVQTASSVWQGVEPTNSVFYLGTSGLCNGSSKEMIAYCFADVIGYQKCGLYKGNGDGTTGSFIYTGFKPKLIVYKNISESDEWFVKDNKRPGHNPTDLMFWSADNAETSLDRLNIYSNGFQLTTTDKGANKNGNSYIYLAIGQTLVGSNDTPATAF